MILCQTPLRISFFGGGTDYPVWFRKHGGVTLTTAIDKYSYITCRYLPPFFEHKHRIVWSKIELPNQVSDIEHPAARAVLEYFGVDRGIEIHYNADLPARSGLGTSSAFTVGLLNSMTALQGRYISREDLAAKAIHIEQEVLHETIGSQDQVIAAFGGFNRIEFLPNGSFSVRPIVLSKTKLHDLQSRLLLCFTGLSRTADVIAKDQVAHFGEHERELFRFKEMVDEAVGIITGVSDDLSGIGRLLHEAWECKRRLSKLISNPFVDELYQKARKAGATGGKLLGAGGGGFMLFYVEPEKRAAVSRALEGLIQVPFRFESSGSHIVLYHPGVVGT